MLEVGLKAKLGREFGEAVTRIHLDAVIGAAAGVGWLEGAVVSRAVESDELVKTITNPLESATGSIDHSVGPAGLASVVLGFADDLLGNLNDSVKNVGETTTELTGRGVFAFWRSLNVCLRRDSKPECECDQQEFLHYSNKVPWETAGWQW